MSAVADVAVVDVQPMDGDDGAAMGVVADDGSLIDDDSGEGDLDDDLGGVADDAGESGAGDDDGAEGDGKSLTAEEQTAVNKRINALTARRKAAEAERDTLRAERDELVKRVENLAEPVVSKVAMTAGVLAELLSKAEAERVAMYQESERSVEFFADWLEDNTDAEDSLELNGREYGRDQVRQFRREHQRRLREMADVPEVVGRLRRESAEIMKLGLAARKAGWKPGEKAAPKKTLGVPAAPAGKGVPRAPAPARVSGVGGKPRRDGDGGVKVDPGKIGNEDDLVAAIGRGAFS